MKNNFTPNPELELARQFIDYTSQCLFLTGKAGTGKTTFLRELKANSPKRLAVAAPTGVAAINAGGQTIHSLFQLPFGPVLPGRSENGQLSRKKARLLRRIDLLIIDEISMVRADMLDGVDRVMRRCRNPRLPFGGVQVLMIGDLHQLPPVAKAEEWQMLSERYETPYFFSSQVWRKSQPVTVQLKHIYRQSDEHFIRLLNKVRENEIDDAVLEQLNRRYRPPSVLKMEPGYISLTTHNHTAKAINREKLAAIPEKLHRFRAAVKGDFPAHAYPAEEWLELKVGAQVMFVKNDSSQDKRYFNGKIGQVAGISEEGIQVRCPGEEKPISVGLAEWQNRKYRMPERGGAVEEDVVGTFTQYPLRLAWAITIHKSQGLTFERVVLDAQSAFAHGQVYVALSRCKTLEGIFLRSPIERSSIQTDQKIQQFSAEAERTAPGAQQLAQARRAFRQDLMLELLDCSGLAVHFNRLRQLMRAYNSSFLPGAVASCLKAADYADEELIPTARQFRQQVRQLLTVEGMPGEAELQGVLRQAASTLLRQVEEQLLPALRRIKLLADNQTAQEQATEALQHLLEELSLKLRCFQAVREGFRMEVYLRARASTAMDSLALSLQQEAELTPEDVAHPELFERLRGWRRALAAAQRLPQYRILPNRSLLEMAQYLPESVEQLQQIHGIGKRRLKAYGEFLLEVIEQYRMEAEKPVPDQVLEH